MRSTAKIWSCNELCVARSTLPERNLESIVKIREHTRNGTAFPALLARERQTLGERWICFSYVRRNVARPPTSNLPTINPSRWSTCRYTREWRWRESEIVLRQFKAPAKWGFRGNKAEDILNAWFPNYTFSRRGRIKSNRERSGGSTSPAVKFAVLISASFKNNWERAGILYI